MTKCRFCSPEIKWDQDAEAHYYPLNSDGTRHNCKSSKPPATPQPISESLIPIRLSVTLGKTLPTGNYSSARGEFHIEAEIPNRVGVDLGKVQLAMDDLKKMVLAALTKWEEENKTAKP